jgi:hypothetical protein
MNPRNLTIRSHGDLRVDHNIYLEAEAASRRAAEAIDPSQWTFHWKVRAHDGRESLLRSERHEAVWRPDRDGRHTVIVTATRLPSDTDVVAAETGEAETAAGVETFFIEERPKVDVNVTGEGALHAVDVSLQRAELINTDDLPLWTVIRASTGKLAFDDYKRWMDKVFCHNGEEWRQELARHVRYALPFPDIVSYKALKIATQAFLMANCGVVTARGDVDPRDEWNAPVRENLASERFRHLSENEREERMGLQRDTAEELWRRYLVKFEPGERLYDEPIEHERNGDHRGDESIETLPYLALIRQQLPELRVELNADAEERVELCYEIMGRKLTAPCFLELIWSYWHEEGMLVQTIDAISNRFENRSSGPRDPLVNFELDPLRPLNNLLWGYIQDEQHRLTITRRCSEYDHEYGLTLYGRRAPRLRSADPRSRFIEAFHTLLHRAAIFYKEDDDTTMIADPFPVLNALRDVHLVLAEGAHNQFGDMPWTARGEMMIQQWLLARPELREFLPTRLMVAYPEPWMDRVDAMKKLQGWTDTSVRYFRDLAVFGEQLLLSIRYGNWGVVVDRNRAANWARYWRQEVQWYINAYEIATGIDLAAEWVETRLGQMPPDRFTQPAFLLRHRLLEQRRRDARLTLGTPRRHPAHLHHHAPHGEHETELEWHPTGG